MYLFIYLFIGRARAVPARIGCASLHRPPRGGSEKGDPTKRKSHVLSRVLVTFTSLKSCWRFSQPDTCPDRVNGTQRATSRSETFNPLSYRAAARLSGS